MLEAYAKLAEYYSLEPEWGQFSLKYLEILRNLKTEFGVTPSSVLDITCGTGDLVQALSRDYTVTGSDISRAMIRVARNKYPERDFYIADMATFRPGRCFDLILSPFDSVNYLIEEDHLLKAFKNVFSLLNPGGYFLFDFNTPLLYEKDHHSTIHRNVQGHRFSQKNDYDRTRRLARAVMDYGDGILEQHLQRAYSFISIADFLKQAGFLQEATRDFNTRKAVSTNSCKILIYARRGV